MPNVQEVTFKINLMQGEPICFKVGSDEERRRNAVSRLEKAMESSYVGVKLAGKLVLIPTQNIQSIEISPPPTTRMQHVVDDAAPLED